MKDGNYTNFNIADFYKVGDTAIGSAAQDDGFVSADIDDSDLPF
jgi:hypothetical protein